MNSKDIYTEREWLLIRIFTLIAWWPWMLLIIFRFDSQPFPEAICTLINCSLITQGIMKWVVVASMAVASMAYIRNRYMLASTLFFAVVTILLISLERSNGFQHRGELYSMVWVAQAIAYLLYRYKGLADKLRLANIPAGANAIQFSKQMIAASFVVAGICKLHAAGIYWVIDSPFIAIQIVKTHYDVAYTFGNMDALIYGKAVASLILEYPNLIRMMFLGALLIELGSFMAVYSKRNAFVVGCFLMAFFIGTLILMKIVIPVFFWYVLTYFLSLPYLVSKLFAKDKSPVLT